MQHRSRFQGIPFLLVGGCAALVHWTGAVLAVHRLGWHPLWANAVAWMLAFWVSFSGHHLLSFRGHGQALGCSLLRFGLVSATGFAVNEVAFALLLRWRGPSYPWLLAGVLVGVALMTYLLSRHWAFLRNEVM